MEAAIARTASQVRGQQRLVLNECPVHAKRAFLSLFRQDAERPGQRIQIEIDSSSVPRIMNADAKPAEAMDDASFHGWLEKIHQEKIADHSMSVARVRTDHCHHHRLPARVQDASEKRPRSRQYSHKGDLQEVCRCLPAVLSFCSFVEFRVACTPSGP